MSKSDWSVEQVDTGWTVCYRGRRWPGTPRATLSEAQNYAMRLAARWPSEEAVEWAFKAYTEPTTRKRGGPWRYSYELNDEQHTGVIHMERLASAKKELRRRLDRQRLPNGIQWEIGQ